MVKLFSYYDSVASNTVLNSISTEFLNTLDSDFKQFTQYSKALNSLINVEANILTLENKDNISSNYFIYNEYLKSISLNLDIPIKNISLENMNYNLEVSLEGIISNIWEKIKEIFKTIYEKIKAFFVKYFTKIGRIKNKLKNLEEVLKETDKDLNSEKRYLDKVPGSLAKKLPFGKEIDNRLIEEVLNNVEKLIKSIDEIKTKASNFSKRDILEKNIILDLNKLKKNIESNKATRQEKENKKFGVKGNIPFTDANKEKKENKEEIKSLSEIISNQEKEQNTKNKEIDKVIELNSNISESDKNTSEEYEIIKKEFLDFLETIKSVLEQTKNKKLPKGIYIKEVKIISEDNLEIETDEYSEIPEGVELSFKETLLKFIHKVNNLLEIAENNFKQISDIIDNFYKTIDNVNIIIKDIDKYGEELNDSRLNKLKKILLNKVKVRLNMAKEFFKTFSQVNKNFYENVTDACEVVIDYSVLSLKYFK